MKTYFTHKFNDPKGRRLTICGILNEDEISFGIARCSRKDQFAKKIGRSIAKGRARKRPIYSALKPTNTIAGHFFMEIARILPNKSFNY